MDASAQNKSQMEAYGMLWQEKVWLRSFMAAGDHKNVTGPPGSTALANALE